MNEANLGLICAIAFLAVMALLGFEAVVIDLISRVFPARTPDNEVMAGVIRQAVNSRFPGATVVSIVEKP